MAETMWLRPCGLLSTLTPLSLSNWVGWCGAVNIVKTDAEKEAVNAAEPSDDALSMAGVTTVTLDAGTRLNLVECDPKPE